MVHIGGMLRIQIVDPRLVQVVGLLAVQVLGLLLMNIVDPRLVGVVGLLMVQIELIGVLVVNIVGLLFVEDAGLLVVAGLLRVGGCRGRLRLARCALDLGMLDKLGTDNIGQMTSGWLLEHLEDPALVILELSRYFVVRRGAMVPYGVRDLFVMGLDAVGCLIGQFHLYRNVSGLSCFSGVFGKVTYVQLGSWVINKPLQVGGAKNVIYCRLGGLCQIGNR